MIKKRMFGELELAILKVFNNQSILTVKQVQEALKGDDKYTTIMTVMNRLVEKKELERQRNGQQYEYWVNAAKPSSSFSLLDRLKQKIFGGKSSTMISFLIESGGDITDQELDEMEKFIKQVKKSRRHS